MRFLLLLILSLTCTALVCENYSSNQCAGIECNEKVCEKHNSTAYCCQEEEEKPSCHCVSYDHTVDQLSLVKLWPTTPLLQQTSCTCQYGGQCYSCGAVVEGCEVCFSDGSWQDCYGKVNQCVNYNAGCE